MQSSARWICSAFSHYRIYGSPLTSFHLSSSCQYLDLSIRLFVIATVYYRCGTRCFCSPGRAFQDKLSATIFKMRSAKLAYPASATRLYWGSKFIVFLSALHDVLMLITFCLAAHTRLPSALASRSVAQLQRNNRSLPSHLQALAILVPQQRVYSTETSTSTGSGSSFPPPGFNAEQAKKPLPTDSRKAVDSTSSKDGNSNSTPGVDHATGKEAKPSEQATLSELGSAEAAIAEAEKRIPAEEKKETKKLTIGQKIKKEIQHYWDGTKLLATEVRISTKLAMKMAAGYELSRRENRQVRQPSVGLRVRMTDFICSCKGP